MCHVDPLLTVATGCFPESETTDNGLIGAADSRMPSMRVPARNRVGGDLREFFIAHQSSLSRAGLKCEPVSGRGIPQFDPEGGSFECVVHAALCATGQPHCFGTKLFEMHGIKGPGLWIEQMFLAQQLQVPVGVSMDATR